MKIVSVLVPPTSVVAGSVEAALDLFSAANDLLVKYGETAIFDVRLTGVSEEAINISRHFKVYPDFSIRDNFRCDLIIIPALNGPWENVVKESRPVQAWISRHYKAGAELAALSTGSFILGAAGLLNGVRCTTHWRSEYEFRRFYPKAMTDCSGILLCDKGIYTSAGGNSYWNLLLHIAEKYAGKEILAPLSARFQIDPDRRSQHLFATFRGNRNHHDSLILEAQQFIEKNFSSRLGVDALADRSTLGRRTFERRFKKATYNTVLEYLQKVRAEAAKKMLSAGMDPDLVMIQCGYNDMKAFREVFRKHTGLSPLDYQQRFKASTEVS